MLSAQVYDHNYCTLSTIFICELRAKDAKSFEVSWRALKAIATHHKLALVHICGFMDDNAQASWIAIHNVFFGGHLDPEQERSNDFHFYQSLYQHMIHGIYKGSREERYVLWEKMQNAQNYVFAD